MDNELIENKEPEAVAFCFDCTTVIPDSRAEKDLFLQHGQTGVCPYCKGPMGVVYDNEVEKLRARRKRGETLI